MPHRSKVKTHSERKDERNVARLGIISVQSRVDAERNFRAEFEVQGRPYRVECAAPYGRPHGTDTDIILAIQTLFVRSGSPEHDWVHTTAYEVLSLAGLPDNGRSYTRLREGFKRLWGTGFIVAEGWHDRQGRRRWSNDTIRYIERIQYHEADSKPDDLPGLDPSARLSLKLGEQLADSIRARVVHVLDGSLLHQLEQPTARALYRLLEAHRTADGGERRMELSVRLGDWRAIWRPSTKGRWNGRWPSCAGRRANAGSRTRRAWWWTCCAIPRSTCWMTERPRSPQRRAPSRWRTPRRRRSRRRVRHSSGWPGCPRTSSSPSCAVACA